MNLQFFNLKIIAYFAEEKKAGKSIKNLDAIVMVSDNKEFIDFLGNLSSGMTLETMDKIRILLQGNPVISYEFVFSPIYLHKL